MNQPAVAALYAMFIGTLLPWVRGDTFGPTVFFAGVATPILVPARLARATPSRRDA
jgi:hypothetical protein